MSKLYALLTANENSAITFKHQQEHDFYDDFVGFNKPIASQKQPIEMVLLDKTHTKKISQTPNDDFLFFYNSYRL